jgi:hypothetical protein
VGENICFRRGQAIRNQTVLRLVRRREHLVAAARVGMWPSYGSPGVLDRPSVSNAAGFAFTLA